MGDYLRRLATTGAAYTASSVLSKLIAVALLPLYTRHLTPSDFGAAEVLLVAVIAATIVIRLGLIEALLRFYYQSGEDRAKVVSSSFAALLWMASAAVALAMPFAEQISEALLDRSEPGLTRIAIAGLWVFAMYEFLLTLFRVDERARAYFWFTIANVLVTIPVTVWLVVFEDEGARGLLIGQFATGAVFLVGLIVAERRRLTLIPDPDVLRRMLRFGLPTMPAELSLYAISFIDRIILVRLAGLAEAGLYALAIKFAQAVNILVRGFQLAWPPLAYSIRDDDEARNAYAVIVTWFLAACSFIVVGMWLLARWIVRLLAAPEFFAAYEAIGLISAGIMLYALYLVMVVILGRTGRTEYSFPATAVATAANIALNLALIPPFGIVGAGIALVISYLIVAALMYVFTQRLFPVPYEWGRIAKVFVVGSALIAAGDLLLPTEGFVGLSSRVALWLAYPVALVATGFLRPAERRGLARLLRPGELAAELRRLREQARTAPEAAAAPSEDEEAGRGPRLTGEVIETELRDEDAAS